MTRHASNLVLLCAAGVLLAAMPVAAQTDVYPNSRCYMKLVSLTENDEIWLDGTSTTDVAVVNSGESTGIAGDSNGNGLDDVSTQLRAWTFTGTSIIHGTVQLQLRANSSTVGMMEELVNNTPGILDVPPFAPTGQVSSFLDVFLEVQMDGKTLYNTTAMHISGILSHEPAIRGDMYSGNTSTTLYVDGTGLISGYAIAEMIYYPYVPTCGDSLHAYPVGDLNHDCRVNFVDFAMFSTHWLECTHPDCIDIGGE
jgi:hypothetical protein